MILKKKQKYSVSFILGCVLSAFILFLTVLGFFWTPYDPTKMNSKLKLAGCSLQHIMGCDNFGRDIFSRVLEGLGSTFSIALATVIFGVFFGIIIGAFTGYYGGWIDEVLMGINNVIFAFPSLLLALVFVSLFGTGKYNVVIALGIAFIPSFARIERGEYINLKNRDFVKSAGLMGAGNMRIIFRHIFPNTFSTLLATVTIGFNNAVLAEAGLSYLGIGIQPPDASLGSMLSDAQSFLFTAPWYAVMPGLAICLFVLGFALLSEGIKRRSGR